MSNCNILLLKSNLPDTVYVCSVYAYISVRLSIPPHCFVCAMGLVPEIKLDWLIDWLTDWLQRTALQLRRCNYTIVRLRASTGSRHEKLCGYTEVAWSYGRMQSRRSCKRCIFSSSAFPAISPICRRFLTAVLMLITWLLGSTVF